MANPRDIRGKKYTPDGSEDFYLEPAMTVGSSIVAEPIAGLAGLAGAVLPGEAGQGSRWVQNVQDTLTYAPKTEQGQAGMQALGESVVGDFGRGFIELSQGMGDTAYDLTGSPALATALYSTPTAALELLGLKGLRKAGKAGSNSRKIIAGKGAKTADLDKMAAAQELAKRGASKDEIWAQTGWFEDVDGNWKFEIPDDQMAWQGRDIYKEMEDALDAGDEAAFAALGREAKDSPPVYNQPQMPLGEAVDHPDLFAAYPDMQDVALKNKQMGYGSDTRGVYTPADDTITLQAEAAPNIKRSYIGHEGQHAIQAREGFATGGSPSDFQPRRQVNTKTNIKNRLKTIEGFEKLGYGADDMAQAQKVFGIDSPYYQMPDGAKITAKELGLTDSQFKKQSLYLEGGDIWDKAAVQRALDDADLYSRNPDVRMDSYKRLAGEAEARTVQHRMNMTPEERLAEPPWKTLERVEGLKPEDLIVRMEANAQTPQQMAAIGEIKNRLTQEQYRPSGAGLGAGAIAEQIQKKVQKHVAKTSENVGHATERERNE